MKRALLTLLLLPALLAADEKGIEIMKQVTAAQKADSSALDIAMTLVEPNGTERERRIQTLTLTEGGLTSTITVFQSPAAVRNTRFLTRQNASGRDDQWIFLPAVGRARRIAAGEGGGSFMGSDFSYADMASTTFSVDDALHNWLRDETLDGKKAAVVESTPTSSSDYGRTLVWVDLATWMPLKVEFYAKDARTLVKRLVCGELAQIDGRWITKRVTMTTVATGHATRVEIQQARFNIPMNSGYFTTTFLETGRAP